MGFNLQAVVVEERRSLKIWMANSRVGLRNAKSGQATLGHRYRYRARKQRPTDESAAAYARGSGTDLAWLDLDMFDKLQFVAGFHHSSTAESPDKLMFVGHFWIRQ